MGNTWQYIIAVVLLIAAIYYVYRRLTRPSHEGSDCNDCGVPAKIKKPVKKKDLSK